MCQCKDVAMGSYDNAIILGYYPIMQDYMQSQRKAGLPANGILVDRCLADEIIQLWEFGIRTYGSCCGHNLVPGMINVGKEDFHKAMLIGYEKYFFPHDPERNDTIIPKSCLPE